MSSIPENKLILSLCDAVAEVIYINVELQRVGHTPFQTQCDGDPHGNTAAKKKKYLTKKIETSETSGLQATQQNCGQDDVLWTLDKPDARLDVKIDPFTGLTQLEKDVNFVSVGTTIEDGSSCTSDTVTNRRTEPGGTYTKCDGSTANRFTEITFQDENTDEKLSTNASSLINHFTIFNTTEIPEYNTFVDVIPGTDGVQNRSGASVSSMPKTEPWRAKHFVDESGINKSQLYVRFIEDTVYTEATGSYEEDGTVSNDYFPAGDSGTVKTATAGEIITIAPPTEKNTFIEIHVCQHLTVCNLPDCDIEVKGTKANESKKALPTADCSPCTGTFGDGCGAAQIPTCPCACVYTDAARFVGTDGKRYGTKTTSSSSSKTANITIDIDVSNTGFGLGGCSTGEPNDELDDSITFEHDGTATITGTVSSSSSSVSITCSDNPDPESDSSGEFEGGGSITTVETTDTGDDSTGECVRTITTDSGDTDMEDFVEFSGGDATAATIGAGSDNCAQDGTTSVGVGITYPVDATSDPNEGTITREITATHSSITSTATSNTTISEDIINTSGEHFSSVVTTSGTVTGSASSSIVLSDPVEAESNYTVTIIPNTSVPEDDPAYDDGVRDGTLTESIDYSGSTRSHIDLTEITFDVTTIPSIQLHERKSLTHRSYLNFLISELDNSDEAKAILSHTTRTELVDTRCNNPYDENDQWTVEKKLALSISLGDQDGNTASVTRTTCFSVVDLDSEDSCPQPN
tara:strand:+ start:7391 stop:9634 length:2244 start_codon:yes stop_codon:yes gene_type:complete